MAPNVRLYQLLAGASREPRQGECPGYLSCVHFNVRRSALTIERFLRTFFMSLPPVFTILLVFASAADDVYASDNQTRWVGSWAAAQQLVEPGSNKIVPASDKTLTFSGSPGVTIPPHSDYLSDPVSFPVNALSDVAITLHIDVPPSDQTGHPGSRATSYFVHGDLVDSAELPGAKTVEHWYFLAGIDVGAPPDARTI